MDEELKNTPQNEGQIPDNEQDENQQQQEQQSPNDEVVNQLLNQEISVEDLDNAYQNGELSEEDYNEIMTKYDEVTNPQQQKQLPSDNQDNQQDQQPIEGDLSSLSDEELQELLQNGDIDQETYDNIINNRDPDQPEEEPTPIVGKYNSVKLFDKFIALKKFINIHLECYDDIEIDELTRMQVLTISRIVNNIKKLREDIIFYINNNFAGEDYKKNLYVYLLFNKKFAEELKKFRNILHLNPDKIIKEREENNKNNKSK